MDFADKYFRWYDKVAMVDHILGPHEPRACDHKYASAIDFVDDVGTLNAQRLCDYINKKYPRNDGKRVILHHSRTSFDGELVEPYFHLQVPDSWVATNRIR